MEIRTLKLISPRPETQLPEWVRNDHLHSQSSVPDKTAELGPHLLTPTEAANQLRIDRQLRFDCKALSCEINNWNVRRN